MPDRGFFFSQADEFITAYNDTLPEHTATPEEVDSGLTGLSEDFGFFASLVRISREMSINPEVLLEWDVKSFYHLQRFLSWESHATNEYGKLMGAKAKHG